MTDPQERLEHLISRCLDGVITPAEQRELRSRVRGDPQADALFDETASLDREFRRVLRSAARSPARYAASARSAGLFGVRGKSPLWVRVLRGAALGAAASVAAFIWMPPTAPKHGAPQGAGAPPVQQAGAWFAPPPSAPPRTVTGDALVAPRASWSDADPRVGEWIVVPGARPGEYLIVEVRRAGDARSRGRGEY